MKIIIKSILECLKILFWITLTAIIILLIKTFIPIALFIALPIAIIFLFVTIYDSKKMSNEEERKD